MSRPVSSIRADIQALSASDRELLLSELIKDLDGNTDSDVESAWLVEINRRLEEIESGAVQLVPAREALERIRKQLAK